MAAIMVCCAKNEKLSPLHYTHIKNQVLLWGCLLLSYSLMLDRCPATNNHFQNPFSLYYNTNYFWDKDSSVFLMHIIEKELSQLIFLGVLYYVFFNLKEQ